MAKVVVVESPAKAGTIEKYLGKDYTVLASYGHVRDLPPKDGSVKPDDNFSMLWELSGKGKRQVDAIAKATRQADTLILATDPDREGEAISWHVLEVLQQKKAIKANTKVERVVFNEITKTAVTKAMANPRGIEHALVEAYLARRALDYLVGFTLSPVLWRKLPGSKSAGRVQSVALRLICEREAEIEAFKPQEYWSLESTLRTDKQEAVIANLSLWQDKKITRLSIGSETEAKAAESDIKTAHPYTVQSIEKKAVKRNPAPPFITSTLQQEASRKLGFSVTRTMQTAQRLYEGTSMGGETVGLITYMRTDGTNISNEALGSIRGLIGQQYGDKYLPEKARIYKTKAKNAQEAHEAIRPTDIKRRPEQVRGLLNDDQYRLYELIWKRTVACQMESAVLDQVAVDLVGSVSGLKLRATGSTIAFDGFYRVYREGRDDVPDTAQNSDERLLPPLKEGQTLHLENVDTQQHFTKPPPRFTEASLVKEMEALGIGRPSTYASIIRILQERNYVRMDSRRFVPEDRGRLVTAFLRHFFSRYLEYDFTAKLEEQLDDITGNRMNFKEFLSQFWKPFLEQVQGTKDLTITEVLDTLNADLAHHFFPQTEGQTLEEARTCPACNEGQLGLKLGRFGAFLGCSNYPECKYTKQLDELKQDEAEGDSVSGDSEQLKTLQNEGQVELGTVEKTGYSVLLCKGPYGHYVQLGTTEQVEADSPPPPLTKAGKPKKTGRPKPRRASLPPGSKPADMTYEKALDLLAFPKELGQHPQTGEGISVGLGRFGPYIKVDDTFVSLKKDDDPYTITLDRAVELFESSGKRKIQVGTYKKKSIAIQKGRFGYFILYGKEKISLPKGTDPEAVTEEQAIERIEARLAAESDSKTASKSKAKSTKGKTTATKKKSTATKKKTTKTKTK